ncbi:hypothetical protein INR49_000775 [Caranx melampygus]|nr:hypothetical protein INR49_000775 [Caranx melampygus]
MLDPQQLEWDMIYRARFGRIFVRTVVLFFRPAGARTRMENTEAEVGLEFNRTASPEDIPSNDAVTETLRCQVRSASKV